jgi:hypothetical protein
MAITADNAGLAVLTEYTPYPVVHSRRLVVSLTKAMKAMEPGQLSGERSFNQLQATWFDVIARQ